MTKSTKQGPAARRKTKAKKTKLTIWEKIAARAAAIPDEELAHIPTDAARNLDHYPYGAPKRD